MHDNGAIIVVNTCIRDNGNVSQTAWMDFQSLTNTPVYPPYGLYITPLHGGYYLLAYPLSLEYALCLHTYNVYGTVG